MESGCLKKSLQQFVGGVIFTAVVACFTSMQNWIYPLEISNWFLKILLGGIHGSLAPFMWVVSMFVDNPHLVPKLAGQGALYGCFWWVALISMIISILVVIAALIGKLFKK